MLPKIWLDMKYVQKYPKKNPFVFSVAQSAIYLPYATHCIDSPRPPRIDVNITIK